MMPPKYACVFLIFYFMLTGCSDSLENIEGISSLDIETDWVISRISASPNGAYLAFDVDGDNDHGIYILEVESENYYAVQKDDDRVWYEAGGAAWSPDSTSLVALYPSHRVGVPGQQSVKSTPFDIVVIDAESGDIIYGVWDGSYATWGSNQDELIILDSDIGKLDQLVPIYRYNTGTGGYEKVAEGFSNSISVYDGLEVSSTGLLAYYDKQNLIIMGLDSREQVGKIRVPGNPSGIYSPVWSPSGEILAYADFRIVNGNRSGKIYFSTPDGACQSSPLELETYVRSLDWLSDGQTMVFTTNEPGKIYFLDLNLGVGQELLDSFHDKCVK